MRNVSAITLLNYNMPSLSKIPDQYVLVKTGYHSGTMGSHEFICKCQIKALLLSLKNSQWLWRPDFPMKTKPDDFIFKSDVNAIKYTYLSK